jgi:mannose-6-phosphate isomerase-like protein (cupin superfamily)
MPRFRGEPGSPPPWCEVESFELIRLLPHESRHIDLLSRKELLFAVTGTCSVMLGGELRDLPNGGHLELGPAERGYDLLQTLEQSTIVRICGRWEGEIGASGVFDLKNDSAHRNDGDPTPYPRSTTFDNHYHDCNEYWIITEGRCVAVSENRMYVLAAGDCLATGMGHHHDIPVVIEPIRGVYFEGCPGGERRSGHLWAHRDGPAFPEPDRI